MAKGKLIGKPTAVETHPEHWGSNLGAQLPATFVAGKASMLHFCWPFSVCTAHRTRHGFGFWGIRSVGGIETWVLWGSNQQVAFLYCGGQNPFRTSWQVVCPYTCWVSSIPAGAAVDFVHRWFHLKP